MSGLSESYYEAMQTIASRIPERPLPNGLNEAETDNWQLACNNGRDPVKWDGVELPGYHIAAIHKQFLVMACIGPDGGAIGGGVTEQQFIDDMKLARVTITSPIDARIEGVGADPALVNSKPAAFRPSGFDPGESK